MNKHKARRARATNRRPTLAERDWIIVQFDEARRKGLQPSDAINGLGTSLASVYRWKRARSAALVDESGRWHIGSALARLTDLSNDDRLSFLEALFTFVSWLRWPNRPNDHPNAVTSCIITYITQKEHAETLRDISSEHLVLLLRHLRLDVLKRMCSESFLTLPIFDPIKIEGQPYVQADVIADITWFLLAYRGSSGSHRDGASLSKAYFASQNNIFRYRWSAAHRTFRTLWHEHGAAGPFLYVERYHPSLEFTLDPASTFFSEQVDQIMLQKNHLITFLARCRGVTQELLLRLDHRAVQAVKFPNFPDTLRSEAVTPPDLPIVTESVMRGFGTGRKRR